ncbi:MAG: relaxase domain-containing protein, partial [Actinomycetota bacterium]
MIRLRGRRTFDAEYYLQDHGRELEHLDISQRAPIGSGVSNWDIQNSVDRRSLDLLAAAQPLRAGRSLAHPRRQILALEVLAVPPKAVSLYALLTPPDVGRLVVGAHHEALEGALRYLEQHGVATNGRDETSGRVTELAGVRFTHGVSRSGDPHLHSHLVLANLGRSAEGRFGALDTRGLHAHLSAASALYDAGVMGACARLGLDLELEPRAIAAFSSRAAEAREDQALGRHQYTRLAKAEGHDQRHLLLEWERRARHLDIDLDQFRSASIDVQVAPRRLDEKEFVRRLLGDDRPVTRRKVVEAWAWASSGQASEKVERNVDAIAGPSRRIFEVGLAPRRVVATAQAIRSLGPRPLDADHLRRWLERAVVIGHTSPTHHDLARTSLDRSRDRRFT